jgi:hypothetical protein
MKTLKYAWQRLTRGYDDRIYWDFEYYIFDIVREPLFKFLVQRIHDKDFRKYNPDKAKIDDEMFILLNEAIEKGGLNQFEYPNPMSEFWEYFGRTIGNYWD